MNKKIMIIGAVIIMILIIIISVIVLHPKEENNTIRVVELIEVFEVKNIKTLNYKTEKNKNQYVASKYIVNDNIYELKAKAQFYDKTGKMIYVREKNNNVNIFQVEYTIDQYDDISLQVEGIIESFTNICKIYLQLDNEEEPITETLYDENTTKAKRPLGESIYLENKLYNITYEVENKKYDVNFYKNNEKMVCEFAYEF